MDDKTKQMMTELEEMSKPIQSWLIKNACPHDTISIQISGVEFVESKFYIVNRDID